MNIGTTRTPDFKNWLRSHEEKNPEEAGSLIDFVLNGMFFHWVLP